MRCMRRKDLRTFIEFYMETHVGADPDGYQQGGRKPTEITVTEFCQESVHTSLEELKTFKVILFSNKMTVQIQKLPKISHF